MTQFFSTYSTIIRILVTLGIGIPLLFAIKKIIHDVIHKKLSEHVSILVSKFVFYIGLLFIITSILHDLGFQLTALLGAAGIMGIAIGFAAQTSVSNIISGIFLLIERPFSIGDTIQFNDITGLVESIDLLAVRVKTPDGKRVRVPNEALVKNVVINKTFYPQQRITFTIAVDNNTNKAAMLRVLEQAVNHCDMCLKKPSPTIFLEKVTYFSTHYSVQIWVPTDQQRKTTTDLISIIQDLCADHSIKAISITHTI